MIRSSTLSRFGAQTRNSQRPGATTRAPRSGPLIDQKDRAEGRQGEIDGPAPAVERNRRRVDAAHVPLAAAAIQWSIAIEDFAPIASGRDADRIVVPREGREIEDH